MRLLILTCSTGEGHNSCAEAVKELVVSRGGECESADALGFVSEKASELISSWHARLYRYLPKLYGGSYDKVENLKGLSNATEIVERLLKSGAERLQAFLDEKKPDAVLCVHVIPGLMLTALKKSSASLPPTGFLATDYTCSPLVETLDVDFFFIPHAELTSEFALQGVPVNRIVPSGIPVRRACCTCGNRIDARIALEMPQYGKNILLMCGSMGCGPMEELTRSLAEKVGGGAGLNVVCGSNKKLLEALEKDCPDNVRLFGYTKNVPLLMDAADLFVTKPGGISITEAAGKRLPMVLVRAVPGLEDRNLDFFVSHGFAETARGVKRLTDKIAGLLMDDEALSRIGGALCGTSRDAAEKIADTLEGCAAERRSAAEK